MQTLHRKGGRSWGDNCHDGSDPHRLSYTHVRHERVDPHEIRSTLTLCQRFSVRLHIRIGISSSTEILKDIPSDGLFVGLVHIQGAVCPGLMVERDEAALERACGQLDSVSNGGCPYE